MDFSRLENYIDRMPERGVPGCDIAVTLEGREVFRRRAGFRRGNERMNGSESVFVYSMTKPLTTCCAMRLIQDGIIRLDDPVGKYIDSFKKYPDMTIEHLMSMRGGLDYDLEAPAVVSEAVNGDTLSVISAMAEKPLQFAPGTDFLYSLCHDVLAGVIERASGERFGEYMDELIFRPLDMIHSSFHPDAWQLNNLMDQYEWTESGVKLISRYYNNYRLNEAYESGGAGLITTCDDYIKFATAMANGGMGIIDQDTIDLWRSRVLTGKAKESFDLLERCGYNYALGVRVLVDDSNTRSSIGEFGWDGAAGAYTLMDPSRKLAVVYIQNVRGFGDVYAKYHPEIRELVYEGLDS